MCGTCGCSDTENAVTITDPETGETQIVRPGSILDETQSAAPHDHHAHDGDHDHHHHEGDDKPHVHGPGGEIISLETAVLQKNDQIALQNRGWFEGRGVLALNLVSSPGAGKTTLLEATISAINDELDIAVIEGDQMTANDANRIREAGAKALQINTGAGCHLEADMISSAVKTLNPAAGSILFIENVGNLVCPAMFDLGEHMKVAIISTTEGEDKPLKYPHMFRASDLVIVNKMDLAPHVDFDEEACLANIKAVNPDAKVLLLSAKSNQGMDQWLAFLKSEVNAPRVRAVR
ncbi:MULTISPECIES: hydrogenase nickel incorporation protein HypB [Pseudomonadota]|jgi:hydrogenase nickel incorporation protein HypB|uniref:hydrogenase nickel incorporation protein HypB n=1 Tax=Pseudomonadota TaxID=1224 RepID=UPI000C5A2891|nr:MULTISPECIES: hydrogenase nickel incorporation protein HypB [Pseudomonadota]MBM07796.1 hydrogenase accessory protein HypB [Sulfitobacter sp.]MBO6686883.1 hydrogenase nickel incorporation protein HypB [Henriciella sp.]MAL43274.1 hydrogenase accessory protein HypB [Hyphomonas sp.]MBE95020.1 hydrogenase accessory protein HypB [Marinobacter sp.]MBO6695751.1 hydrogenase nickel incorporation protein HypB [Henriciella sp.]|tara:strand:+ start:18697 stop:19572 length:876 start_codon:yes stop_codon:yes gene_type:complete